MSQQRTFPIYTVRTQDDVGCGHQHSSQEVAENCANNMLAQHKMMPLVDVIRIRHKTKSDTLIQSTIKTIEQPFGKTLT